MTEVQKLIEIATAEVGYLEKKSNSNLYDKTSNAGSGNYTKYWYEVSQTYQGQAWCACFITWCLMKAFGKEVAAEMLGHYPYISCITGKSKAQQQGRWNSRPTVGSIIIFGNSAGTPSHTGLVYAFDSSKVYTIEGNTSSGSTVIANGGAVCKKSYNRNYNRILGYWNIDYSKVEGDALSLNQYEELKQLIAAKDDIINLMGTEIKNLKEKVNKQPMIYNYIDSNMPEWAKRSVQWCVDNGIIEGTDEGLGLDDKDLRWCTIIYRTAKLYGKLINVNI